MLCASTAVLIVCLCLFFLFLCLVIVDCSTLGTAGMDIVGICLVGFFIDLVWHVLLLLILRGTLYLAGSRVVVVGVYAIDVLWCIARSMI